MNSRITIPAVSLGALLLALATIGFTSAAPASAPVVEASAKATCSVSDIYLMNTTSGAGWTTVLSNTIKTASNSDIFCDVSLESGLVTQTLVASKGGKTDTSTAEAEIRVRCLIDGKVAYPGEVVFNSRRQQITAKFQGIIAECFTANEDGTVTLDESCVEAEELNLVLSTMAANAFNFVCPNTGTGTHTLQVQAKVTTSSYAEAGTASAFGVLGKGSCTIEQVRMTNGEVIF